MTIEEMGGQLCELCAACIHRTECPRGGPYPSPLVVCTNYEQGAVPRSASAKKDTGTKHDSGKLRWDLIQPLILQEYVKVLTEGAKKYAPHNWRKVPDQRNRYFAALLRHIWAWWLGERNDPEWGLHHFAHAMCCLTFLAEPELEAELQKCQHPKDHWVPSSGWMCNLCKEVMVESSHEHHTGSAGVRIPGSPGSEGSGGGFSESSGSRAVASEDRTPEWNHQAFPDGSVAGAFGSTARGDELSFGLAASAQEDH